MTESIYSLGTGRGALYSQYFDDKEMLKSQNKESSQKKKDSMPPRYSYISDKTPTTSAKKLQS